MGSKGYTIRNKTKLPGQPHATVESARKIILQEVNTITQQNQQPRRERRGMLFS